MVRVCEGKLAEFKTDIYDFFLIQDTFAFDN